MPRTFFTQRHGQLYSASMKHLITRRATFAVAALALAALGLTFAFRSSRTSSTAPDKPVPLTDQPRLGAERLQRKAGAKAPGLGSLTQAAGAALINHAQ